MRAVFEIAGFACAVGAFADGFGVVTKVYCHAVVEHAQAALPQTIVTIFFTVFYYATIYLVYVGKATLFHHGAYYFAANTACAVANHFFVFNIVVFVTFKFGDKVTAGISVRYYGVFKLADFGFVRVAAVEKHYVVAVFFDHLVHLLGL